jgi:hypothetical protein
MRIAEYLLFKKPAHEISQYIDYVIGMNSPIQDRAAMYLLKDFMMDWVIKLLIIKMCFQRAFDEGMVP